MLQSNVGHKAGVVAPNQKKRWANRIHTSTVTNIPLKMHPTQAKSWLTKIVTPSSAF